MLIKKPLSQASDIDSVVHQRETEKPLPHHELTLHSPRKVGHVFHSFHLNVFQYSPDIALLVFLIHTDDVVQLVEKIS